MELWRCVSTFLLVPALTILVAIATQWLLHQQMTRGSGSVSTTLRSARSGAVYVRWGSRSCPTSSDLVYTGVVGGGHFTHTGAAVNGLCLPLNPVYDGKSRTSTGSVYLYGAEYETDPEPSHDEDVVCAVCVASRSLVLMVPGTTSCPKGWLREYTGYLMSGHHTHAAATETLCVDSGLTTAPNSDVDNNGKLFYYVVGQCGSLPCPPFHHDKVLTCVVCSQ